MTTEAELKCCICKSNLKGVRKYITVTPDSVGGERGCQGCQRKSFEMKGSFKWFLEDEKNSARKGRRRRVFQGQCLWAWLETSMRQLRDAQVCLWALISPTPSWEWVSFTRCDIGPLDSCSLTSPQNSFSISSTEVLWSLIFFIFYTLIQDFSSVSEFQRILVLDRISAERENMWLFSFCLKVAISR